MSRTVAIVTSADSNVVLPVIQACGDAARAGHEVRVFFRDESIPSICQPEVAARLSEPPSSSGNDGAPEDPLRELLGALIRYGDVRLYACSSSLYLWGVTPKQLVPAVSGARGLIAFLVDDLAGADRVLTC